jgi:capsular polysaccharide biosynthesis protein/Mrp family chromosome partitioning ATPase
MGFLVAERLPATYESEATLLVGPVSADRDTLQAAGSQARTYAGVTETAVVVDRAAAEVGLTPGSVKSKVDVTASDVTRLITIRARDSDAVRAAAIANGIAGSLVAYSRQLGFTPPEGRLQVVERATPSTSPIGPSQQLIVPLAAIAGLLVALGLAALVDSLSTAVRSEEDLATAAPVAFLGSVDGTRLNPFGRAIALGSDPNSSMAAGYRLLAVKIELSNGERPLRSILLLDAHGGRSSVSLATNLASALAEGGASVSLIDAGQQADAKPFGILRKPGLVESHVRPARPLRAGRVMLDRVRVKGSRLSIIRPRNAMEPLELDQATTIIDRVLADSDVVVLTVRPVDRSPNSLVWSRAADVTVLVTERDHTKREQIPVALESLRLAGANVIGTVLCKDRIL